MSFLSQHLNSKLKSDKWSSLWWKIQLKFMDNTVPSFPPSSILPPYPFSTVRSGTPRDSHLKGVFSNLQTVVVLSWRVYLTYILARVVEFHCDHITHGCVSIFQNVTAFISNLDLIKWNESIIQIWRVWRDG